MPGKPDRSERPQNGYRILSPDDTFYFPELEEFYTFWKKLRGDLEAPRPWEFDLLDLPHLLQHLTHAGVIDGGKDYYNKFIGQSQVNQLEADPTSRLASQMPKNVVSQRTIQVFDLVVSSRKPVINGLHKPGRKMKNFKTIQSLSLPLIEDGEVKEIVTILQWT